MSIALHNEEALGAYLVRVVTVFGLPFHKEGAACVGAGFTLLFVSNASVRLAH